ncbi:MAG: ABC transporter ATP-binding protein [Actinomycetota bacterium]|nr:ABC transporter ATP-binding protein [Actinomycetota bacterium]
MAEAEGATFSIEASGLVKRFGPNPALDGLDLALSGAEVTALVGPNGAGKTTLLLVLAALLAPDDGSARVNGFDVVRETKSVHRAVGWMPDFFGVYDDLTSREYLELFGAAYRMSKTESAQRAEELIERLRIGHLADARVHTLSRGQKQKLGLARAIVHRPQVLLLDEPASGLDPQGRVELRDLVREEASSGTAVLISSHILGDLEELADRVVFMERGRTRRVAAVEDLSLLQQARQWRVRALETDVLTKSLAAAGVEVVAQTSRGTIITLRDDRHAAEVNGVLVAAGAKVVEFAPVQRAIEEAFMSLDQGGAA